MTKLDRSNIKSQYLDMVEDIAEQCDWVTTFGPTEIVDMICDIIESNGLLVKNRGEDVK
jgi:hypothetical protein